MRDLQAAAHAMGLQIQIFNASAGDEIDAAYTAIVRERPDALFCCARSRLQQQACPIGSVWRRATRSRQYIGSGSLPRSAD